MATITGTLPGQFSVDANGCGTYTIPIQVPPAPESALPSIALSYHSGAGDGCLGVGWRLDGLSSITRAGATVAQDGLVTAVRYDAGDRFLLDGARLVIVNSVAYDSPEAEYHTEVESWHRVTPIYGSTAGRQGPDGFRVIDRDGTRYEYGQQPNTQVPASADNPSIRIWHLSRITDLHGNQICFKYLHDDTSHESYVQRIDYGANGDQPSKGAVEFTYQPKPQPWSRYVGGYPVITRQQLAQVATFHDGEPVLTYQLDYEQGRATGRGRLRSVTLTDKAGMTLPPTMFEWYDADAGALTPPLSLPPPGALWGGTPLPMDVNGDGRLELVQAWAENDELQLTIYTPLADGSGFGPPNTMAPSGLPFGGDLLPIDVDGDGRTDLVYAVNINGRLRLTVFHSEQDPAGVWRLVPGPLNQAGPDDAYFGGDLYAADVDGDGCVDLIYAVQDGQSLGLRIWFSDGQSFAPSPTDHTRPTVGSGGKCYTLDLDGDGRSDLVYATSELDVLVLTRFTSAGRDGFVQESTPALPPGTKLPGTSTLIPMDINGDGNWDLLCVRQDANTLRLRPLFSNGIGFTVGDEMATSVREGATLCPAEMNGDGMGDLIALAPNEHGGTDITVMLSTGDAFVELPATTILSGVPTDGIWVPLDIAGVGRTGLVYQTKLPSGNLGLTLLSPGGAFPDLLSAVTNGYGGRTEIVYRPMTDPCVYSTSGDRAEGHAEVVSLMSNTVSGATFGPNGSTPGACPTTRLADFPRYLVSSYTESDRRDGTYLHTASYRNARLDLRGRGWLGFESMQQTDADAGTSIITHYDQAFPGIGAPLGSELVSTRTGAMLRRTAISYRTTPSSKGSTSHWQQGVATSLLTNGQVDYTHERTVVTFDVYGNPLLSSDGAGAAGPPVYTTRAFLNDDAKGVVGACIEEKVTADAGGTVVLSWRKTEHDPATFDVVRDRIWVDSTNQWLDFVHTYDWFGNRVSTQDPSGAVNTVDYDPSGTFVVRVKTPPTADGSPIVMTFQHDPAFGVEIMHVDANGQTFTNTVDGFGRIICSAGPPPAGGEAKVQLSQHVLGADAVGTYQEQRTAVDWAGTAWFWQRDYIDGLSRVFRSVSLAGDGSGTITIDRRHDSRHHVCWETEPYQDGEPAATLSSYDGLGRLVSVEEPDGSGGTVLMRCDYPNALTKVHTEAAGTPFERQTRLEHGVFQGKQQVIRKVDAAGAVTTLAHDPLGRQTCATDPLGVSTVIAYDSTNRRVAETVQRDTHMYAAQTFSYDDVARETRAQWAGSGTVTMRYDALGRPAIRIAGDVTTTFTYDAPGTGFRRGRLASVSMTGGSGYDFWYDAHGNQTLLMPLIDGTSYGFTREYAPTGSITAEVLPDGTRVERRFTAGRALAAVTIAQSPVPLVEYSNFSAHGAARHASFANGTRETLDYDGRGRFISRRLQAGNGTNLLWKQVKWNPLAAVASITDGVDPARSETFEYDVLGRLSAATGGYGKLVFGLDAGGNLIAKDGNRYEYDGHQVVRGTAADGSPSFCGAYDTAGNLTKKVEGPKSSRLQYDAERRLASVDATTFRYDYAGRRIEKHRGDGSAITYVGPHYELHAATAGTAVAPRKYIAGAHGIVCAIGADGVSFLHGDHLGSVCLRTDDTGQPITRIDYRPFGEVDRIVGDDSIERRFAGQELDPETGLYHLQARYYHPGVGRFVSADDVIGGHVGSADVFNRYAYALNVPTVFTDPSGQAVWWHWAAEGALIAAGIGLTIATAGAASPAVAIIGGLAGSVLMGAGESALMNTAVHAHDNESNKEWATQLGIGAATGLLSGAATGATAIRGSLRITRAAESALRAARTAGAVAGVVTRAETQLIKFGVRMSMSVVSGLAEAVTGQLLNNQVHDEKAGKGLGSAALFGLGMGVAGGAMGFEIQRRYVNRVVHAAPVGGIGGGVFTRAPQMSRSVARRLLVPQLLADSGFHAMQKFNVLPVW